MENFCDAKWRNKSMKTDESGRLRKRPTATNTLEDFGSSFTKLDTGTRCDAKKTKNPFAKTENHGKTSSIHSFQRIDESDDELLLSSQPSVAIIKEDDLRLSSTKAHKQKSRETVANKHSSLQHQGSQASKPHTSEVVKKMKFNKNKKGTESNTSVQEPVLSLSSRSSSSHTPPDAVGVSRNRCSKARSKDSCDDDSNASDPPGSKRVKHQVSAPSINNGTPRPKPRSLNKLTNRRELALEEIPVNSQVKNSSQQQEKVKGTGCSNSPIESRRKPVTDTNFTRRSTLTPVHPIVKPRPVREEVKNGADLSHRIPSIKKPRVPKPTSEKPELGSSTETSRTPLRKPQNFPPLSPLYSQKSDCASRSSPTPDCKSKQKGLSPKPFPLSLPEEQEKAPSATDCKSNLKRLSPESFPLSLTNESGRNSPAVDCGSKHKGPLLDPFPLSLLKEKGKMPSNDISDDDGNSTSKKPRPRPKRPKTDKGMLKADRNRERAFKRDGKKSSVLAPQPFPMNTQMLKSTGFDGLPSSSALRNRTSFSSSLKRRKKRNLVIASSDEDTRGSGCDWDEDFSVTLSVDPKLLCPFCDVLLPQPITPFLRKLINNALKKSRHDPRPGNPLGRKAPSALFITVCQRHTFESEELPKAEANGWPKSIDWEQLGDRIRGMRDDLEDLLSDLRAGTSTSLLWKDVKRELRTKGSRAMVSVREQFANFEKAQAGYYGELGYAIIHQSLLDLFPPTSYDLEFTNPLTPEQFFQRVLVPEVALRLIQEDMGLRGATHIAKALQVLRDSSKYGVAMFPDDSHDNSMGIADPGQLGVADMIVMKRARKRRQELEEEYQKEQEEQEHRRREERKDKERIKKTKNNIDDKPAGKRSKPMREETGHETEAEIFRPKPRPLQKKRSASQSSTSEHSGYEGSEECFTNCPQTSQESFALYGLYESSGNDLFTRPEDEILEPDSDEAKENKTYSFARRATKRAPSLATVSTEPVSEHDAGMTSSSEDIIGSPTSGNGRKKQRDWEDEESTPKPAKFPRTGVYGVKDSNSHPLLLARQRRRQPSGTEFAPTAMVVNNSGTCNDGDGIWVKSMIVPVDAAGSTLRRQWSRDFAWLLSDGSQE